MPWSIQKKMMDGKMMHCVIKDSDKSEVACHDTPEKAENQRKALYANEKLELAQERIMLEGVGPALVAVAVTAKPHLRQRGKEIKIVEIGDKKFVEVPLYKKGIYRHPKGELVFNDPFINRMIANHKARVTDYNVHLDFRHDEKQGALAFLDPDDGGYLELKGDGWLYAYGPPADEEAEKIIQSRKWRYASPEFAPNYESNFVQKLSSDEMTEIQLEDLIESEEEIMTLKLTLGTKTIVLEGEDQVKEVEKLFGDLQAQITTLETKVTELTPDPEPELPEAFRIRLEALEADNKRKDEENRRLEQERRAEKVNLVLEKARNHRDNRGYGHDKVFLDLVESALKLEDYKEGESVVVKLEDGARSDLGKLIHFYNTIFTTMLEKCPGTVPMTTHTERTEVRLESGVNGYGHYTQEEFEQAQKDFWK